MKDADFIAPPCDCAECRQAGVSHLEIRRDPYTGRWLHGYELRRWWTSFNAYRASARAAVGLKGRHAAGLERLAVREPGSEG